MNINNFIDSIEQTTENELENIFEHVSAQFQSEKNAKKDEKKTIKQSKIKISEAFTALQQLYLYEEQQSESDSVFQFC